jgi:glycosyltransferase involved in cell wall biosynthesis
MKILYQHRTISKDGQDVHIQEMVAALKRRGHEVIVVAPPTVDGAAFGSDGGLLSKLRRRLPRLVSELLELAYSVPAYRRLYRAWKTHRPDILYERYSLYFLPGAWLKAKTGIPLLLEVNSPLRHERQRHGGLAVPALARWSERKVWQSADRLLAVTHVLASYLVPEGVRPERICVIPNGVDRQRFPAVVDGADARAELGLGNQLVLGFTGFIRAWHGLARVLDVMAALSGEHDLHFLVIGDGPGRGEIEAKAAALGLGDRVRFLGIVDRDRVGRYIATFDVALQPQAVDYASPLKLFEYMALGRAILAPDQPNIREVLSDGEDALLFSADDDQSFRDCLTKLCRDSALRQRLGAAAQQAVETKGFTWDGNARRVEELAMALVVEGPLRDNRSIGRAPGPKPERRLSQGFRGGGNQH